MLKIVIDGREYESEPGRNILEVCLENGIYIPHLCYQNELHPIGACRLCVVKIAGREGLAPSCATEVEDGMEILVQNEEINETRQMAIELMLSGHQADCGTCVKYLNCELQSLKQYLVADELSVRRRSRLFAVTDTNPIFNHEPNKCVLCGRCVRACRDLRGIGILYYKHDHGETYIGVGTDPDKNVTLAEGGCRFCGACAEVCPTGAVLDRDEFGKNKSRSAALLPCSNTCPAEIDIPGYIRFIREGNASAAAALIREKVPFPHVLGHVCSHPCEAVCRRGQVNQPLSICRLKRYAAENDKERMWADNIQKKAVTGKRVAVIGAGPAGLTAAYYLTLLGHSVTVFEEMPEPGGMLRYGIPEYRLPRQVLEDEMKDIVNTGVEIRTNTKIESIDALFSENYDAVLIAVGARRGVRLKIPGAKGDGVMTGTEFLRAARMGESVSLGQRLMVLGGGSVAFDCARVARRLGVKEVMLACLEPEEAMPASSGEIAEGKQEGVEIYPARSFKRIIREDSRVTGVEFLMVDSFYYDEDKRPQIETAEDSNHIIGTDTVIFAVGQLPEIPESFGVDLTDRGLVDADTSSMSTNRDGVFAAADAVTGTDMVISAISSGRRAAQMIDKFLGGRGKQDQKLAPVTQPLKRFGSYDGFAELARAPEELEPPDERICDFRVVEHSLGERQAIEEANRCLQCDVRLKMKPEKFWSSY